MEKVHKLLKQSSSLRDRKLARKLRNAAVDSLIDFKKTAQSQQSGIFQVFRDEVVEYPTKKNKVVERGGTATDKLYGLGPEHKKSKPSVREVPRSLSTRYSPDRVGVQARRIADGVYQDPYTNKIYDWNEGFTTEDGEKISGGNVSLQTDLVHK